MGLWVGTGFKCIALPLGGEEINNIVAEKIKPRRIPKSVVCHDAFIWLPNFIRFCILADINQYSLVLATVKFVMELHRFPNLASY